jgi:hypothetical protein
MCSGQWAGGLMQILTRPPDTGGIAPSFSQFRKENLFRKEKTKKPFFACSTLKAPSFKLNNVGY